MFLPIPNEPIRLPLSSKGSHCRLSSRSFERWPRGRTAGWSIAWSLTTAPEPGSWLVEGIGEDFIPSICNLDLVDKAYTITDKQAMLASRELLLKEGIMAGSSTGVLLQAALNYCREQTEPKKVVTLVCDTGNRYLSKLYSDDWMKQQGFLD